MVFITAHGTTETAIEAMKKGAFDYLIKPVDLDRLSQVIERAFDAARLMQVPAVLPVEDSGDRIVGREDGAIPKKYRELIALAVACTTQCPYCLEIHAKAAKKAGASREEVVEASLLAAALRAGGAATHGAMALKFFDKD